MSKQDRQGVRTPADIERKYDLGSMASDAEKIKSLNRELTQLEADVGQRFAEQTKVNEQQTSAINSLTETVDGMLSAVYPVGSVYISVNSVNPSTLFGGTWESVGEGYLMMGLEQESEEAQTEIKFLDNCYIWKRTS